MLEISILPSELESDCDQILRLFRIRSNSCAHKRNWFFVSCDVEAEFLGLSLVAVRAYMNVLVSGSPELQVFYIHPMDTDVPSVVIPLY